MRPISRSGISGVTDADASAVIVGAGSAIGAALGDTVAGFGVVHRLSRGSTPPLDVTDPAGIAAAADHVRQGPPPRLVIVASGVLHDAAHGPERSWRDLDPDWMAHSFAVNTIGPALVARHFLPLMPRSGRHVFAVLSARVGSITDNRTGGWHSYRASKAALNMIVRNLAIERARQSAEGIVVALHPGTVATPMSAPFAGNVPPERLFTPALAARQLLDVIDRLTPADSGRVFAWDGTPIDP